MMILKGKNKSVFWLLLARFLFVKLFIEVASLFTLRGRREGVSWVGERISWKFAHFLSWYTVCLGINGGDEKNVECNLDCGI